MNRYSLIYCFIGLLACSFYGFAQTTTSDEFAVTQTLIDSIPSDDSALEIRRFEDVKNTYTDEEFIYERNIESSGWWTRFKQWLNDLFRSLFNLNSEGQASKATDLALKIGGVIIFLLVIYFIFKAVMNDEGNWVFGKSSDKSIIPVMDIENHLHTSDFKQLIEAAEQENNHRLAIRYYYLWLLKDLNNAEIIYYDVEKTNSDYYHEISSTSIKDEFSYTSYLYNYIWYGEFDVTQEQFNKAKIAFINFLKTIKA